MTNGMSANARSTTEDELNINDAFPSKYLKSEDIGERRVSVTLDRCEMEQMPGDKVEVKPVLYFRGKEKGLVLNVTNSNTLSEAYGCETDEWTGKLGVLYTVDTEFAGRRMKGLRIGVPAQPKPEPAAVGEWGSEDDLPF